MNRETGMIIKKLKSTSFTKPKATMISNLVDYILAPKDENGNEKTAYARAKNFFAATQAGQKKEMIALALESIQSKMPVTHWIVSWQENEQPSREQIDEAVDVFLDRMGLSGHQVIYALHDNTGNCHVHIVVNRTHPVTMKVIQPHKGFDIEEAHKTAAWLEHTQGWAGEDRSRYAVTENGEIVRRTRQSSVQPKAGALNFEEGAGEKSAQRIAQERGHKIIQNARSWRELHERLAEAGLRFEKKGSGAVVFVGDIAVKASSVDRVFGLGKLCKRLGEYEPGSYTPDMKIPEAEPVSTVTLEEWRQYRKLRAGETEKAREEKQREAEIILRAKVTQRGHRRAALSALARHGIHVLNIARHFLKEQQREELKVTRAAMPKRKHRALPRFKTWLRQKNLVRAGALWRFRRRIPPGMAVEQYSFSGPDGLASPYMAYREVLRKRYPETTDASRLDAAVALWMRVTGYSREETANEMYRHARPLREESRDWKSYARRAVWYAFGAAGDIDIATFQPTQEKIQRFRQETAQAEAERHAAKRAKESATGWKRPRMR
jgi:hypothetical protein